MKRSKKPGNPFERLVAWHSRKPWQVHLSMTGILALFIVTCLVTAQGVVHAQPAPSVNIIAPTDGATVSGSSVALSASTAGGTSTALDFIFSDVSGTTIGAVTSDAGATWTATLDSTTFSDGATTLIASSTIDGVNVTSTLINLTVHNAPVVTITNPNDGATVSGSSVPLAASISAGVSTTASALNFIFSDTSGTTINATSTDGVSWTANLDSTTFVDGATTLVASSTVNGANVTSAVTNLTIHNAPTITITAPTDGSTISGSNVLLSATTTNGLATAVEFDLAGATSTVLIATSASLSSPWTVHLDTTTLSDGTSTIIASSTMNGVNVTSSRMSVNVNNAGGGGGGGGSGGGIPTVTMISPQDGQLVTSTFQWVAQVQNGNATHVHFRPPDSEENPNDAVAVEGPSGIWTYPITIDAGYLPEGPFPVLAVATINGSNIQSQPITFTIGHDGTDPYVRILDPSIFLGDGNKIFGAGAFEAKVFNAVPDDQSFSIKINGQPAVFGQDAFFIPFDLTNTVWFVEISSANFPLGDLTVVADMTVNGTPYESAPMHFDNVGTPVGSILKPLDCEVLPKTGISLATRVDREIPFLNYIITYNYPNNQPLEEGDLVTETIPASFDPSSHTWNATWDATNKGVGTYTIQSMGQNANNESQFDFGHVSVAVGMNQCFFQTAAGANAPTILMKSPLTNASVSGTVPLIATSGAAVSASFEVLNKNAGVDTQIPAKFQDLSWTATWDSTQSKNGTYTIIPSGVDGKGNSFAGDQILVNVVNLGSMSTSTMATSTLDFATSTDLTQFMPTDLSFDPTATGTYAADVALALNPSIDADAGITSVSSTPNCAAGSLIKLADDRNRKTVIDAAVYYCGQDGQRYVFPSANVFFSWYSDFSSVMILDADTMQSIPVGGIVHYRPGSRMVKVPNDPRVYAVARGGVLRWITTEGLARQLYGDDWNTKVDDLFDGFFDTYQVGAPITEGSQVPAPAVADTSTTTTQAASNNSDNATKK